MEKVSEGKCAQHGRNAKFPELEADILEWVEGHCQNGVTVTTKMIDTHALKLAQDSNIEDFEGGATWCCCVLKHNGLFACTKTKVHQKMPSEYVEKMLWQ